jgi:hypothetical protein
MFNEAVAVEVVRGLEREERAHAHNDGAEYFIANVEVVVKEVAAAAKLKRQIAGSRLVSFSVCTTGTEIN